MTTQNTETDAIVVEPEDLVIRKMLPGILVKLDCNIISGRYTRRHNQTIENRDDGAEIKRAETEAVIANKVEFEAADALRAGIKRSIDRLGCKTGPGLIVPIMRQQELAQKLALGRAKVGKWNEEAEHHDLSYHFWTWEVDTTSKSTLASINDQLEGILDRVNEAASASDAVLLTKAKRSDFPETYKTVADFLDRAPDDERREVMAKFRARLARKAISEAATFSSILPEEIGRSVDSLVKDLRAKATGWVKAAQDDEAAYEAALNAVNVEGISDMQAALVIAAQKNAAIVNATVDAVATAEGPVEGFALDGGIDHDEDVIVETSMVGALVMGDDIE